MFAKTRCLTKAHSGPAWPSWDHPTPRGLCFLLLVSADLGKPWQPYTGGSSGLSYSPREGSPENSRFGTNF